MPPPWPGTIVPSASWKYMVFLNGHCHMPPAAEVSNVRPAPESGVISVNFASAGSVLTSTTSPTASSFVAGSTYALSLKTSPVRVIG